MAKATGAKKTSATPAAAKTTAAKKPATPVNEDARSIAKSIGVSKLYENSKGEYFTDHNLALISDKRDNIKTHDFTGDSDTVTDLKMQKVVITEDHLKMNPELLEQGVKVGDEVEVPV